MSAFKRRKIHPGMMTRAKNIDEVGDSLKAVQRKVVIRPGKNPVSQSGLYLTKHNIAVRFDIELLPQSEAT